MSQFERLTAGSFKNSTAKRLPICFCLDISGSMMELTASGSHRIDEMNRAFNNFLLTMKDNEVVADAADIAVLTFGGDVHVEVPMMPISQVEAQEYKVQKWSLTPLGEAIKTAVRLLELRKNGYKDNGMKYFQPWLVVITDGEPEGNGAKKEMQEAIVELNKLEAEGKIVIFPVGIGTDVDFRELRKISRKRSEPIRVDEERLAEFFDFLNSSSEQVVTGQLETEELNRQLNESGLERESGDDYAEDTGDDSEDDGPQGIDISKWGV